MCWTKRSSVKNLIYSGQLLYSYTGFISRTSTNKTSGKRTSLSFQECHKKFYVECLEWWSGPCWLQKPLRPTISLWWIVSKIGRFWRQILNFAPNFEFRAPNLFPNRKISEVFSKIDYRRKFWPKTSNWVSML